MGRRGHFAFLLFAKKKGVILLIVAYYNTYPSSCSLPPTIIQWCVVLSRSTIGVVVVVIATTVVAAAAVAPSLPAAPPDRRLLRHRRIRSPPPCRCRPPIAIGTLSASSTPPGAGTIAGAAVPGIDGGARPTSDDQLPPPLSPPPSLPCYLWDDIEISNIEEGRALNLWLIGL